MDETSSEAGYVPPQFTSSGRPVKRIEPGGPDGSDGSGRPAFSAKIKNRQSYLILIGEFKVPGKVVAFAEKRNGDEEQMSLALPGENKYDLDFVIIDGGGTFIFRIQGPTRNGATYRFWSMKDHRLIVIFTDDAGKATRVRYNIPNIKRKRKIRVLDDEESYSIPPKKRKPWEDAESTLAAPAPAIQREQAPIAGLIAESDKNIKAIKEKISTGIKKVKEDLAHHRQEIAKLTKQRMKMERDMTRLNGVLDLIERYGD